MKRTTVEKEGFFGIYHPAEKPQDEKRAIIVIGGSEGNENIPMNVGAMFAKRGVSALGICYWNVPGLPKELIHVPLEPFEKAVKWLQKKGYERIFIYGISKGGELALLCASLIPDIAGVIALSPIHCIWGGMSGNKSMVSKTFKRESEFTWRGKDFPCMIAQLKYGPAIWNLIKEQQFNLAYMYEKPLQNFDEQTAIPVENICGDILFIYAKEDLMWPSGSAVEYMVKRLKQHNWKYHTEILEYEKASHIIVPLNPSKLKMFKVERKYPEECSRSRMDAFEKTIQWLMKR